MRKKFTSTQASDELDEAYRQGEKVGLDSLLGGWAAESPYMYGDTRWSRHLNNAWYRGRAEGKRKRKVELEEVTASQVKRLVAAAIAELPECKPTEEEPPMKVVYHMDGTVTVNDGR